MLAGAPGGPLAIVTAVLGSIVCTGREVGERWERGGEGGREVGERWERGGREVGERWERGGREVGERWER